MAKRDYYEILEVSKDASDSDLKKAYRRLAMKYHPDRNPGDEEAEARFKEIKEAYEVLSDPQKRQAYDQMGHEGVSGQGGFGGGAQGFGGFDFGDIFEDMFGDMFGGGGRQRSRAQAGADLQYELTLSLEEAIQGKTVDIKIPTFESCQDCKGSGAKKGTKPQKCSQCDGQGALHIQQGFLAVQQTCPYCKGQGTVIKDPCGSCRGEGRRRVEQTVAVKVPPGVDTGNRIRISGKGEAGANGGPDGDLYVLINVKPHKIFERQRNDLKCEVPISFTVAALGGEVEVPTLEGKVKLEVPEETQTGKQLRLRGKGVKSVNTHTPGDLICQVVVETPVNLTKKQQELLRELDESMDNDDISHCPRKRSWLDYAKRFFENITSS